MNTFCAGSNDSQLIYEQYRTITEQGYALLRPPPPPRPRAEWRRVNAAGHDDEPVIDEYGTKHWYNDRGEFHRVDGPAIEHANGDKEWYINGKLHREDGPAYEFADVPALVQRWYINGKNYKSIPEWAEALFEYKGLTRETLKNTGRDYNTLLNAVIGVMKGRYGK